MDGDVTSTFGRLKASSLTVPVRRVFSLGEIQTMREVILSSIILLAVSPLAIAQSKGKDTNLNARTVQELIRIENQLVDALLKRDVSVFEQFLRNDYIFTDAGSHVHSKADVLRYLKSGDLINELARLRSSEFE